MNENNKKTLKGFTLIELIIVLAIFSGIMAGAISLIDPVSKIMTKASVSEKTNSYVNTIQDYVEGSVKYAENLNVYVVNYVTEGYSSEDAMVAEMVENYRKTYFSNCVSKNPNGRNYFTKDEYVLHMLEGYEGTEPEKEQEKWEKDYDDYVTNHPQYIKNGAMLELNPEPFIVLDNKDNKITTSNDSSNNIVSTTGKIRVLCLNNIADGDITHNGNITLREVPFDSYIPIKTNMIPASKQAINEAYFNAADSHYTFSYVLGATDLMNVDEGIVFKSDYEEKELDINSYNFSITVLTSKTQGTVPSLVLNTNDEGDPISYTPFDKPAAATVINLPLMNINRRAGNIVQRPYCGTVDGKMTLDASNNPVINIRAQDAAKAFTIGTSVVPAGSSNPITADLQKNIYFVYNYTDEIN